MLRLESIKMKKDKILIKVFFVALFLLSLSFGATALSAGGVPLIFSYQGRLSDSNGVLLGGPGGATYYFKFSIWNTATGGTSGVNRLWPSGGPSAVSSTVRQGLFNINIGDTANGYPDELDYNFNTNKDIFFQTEVSSDGITFETLLPRQRVASSIFAQLAGAVSGVGQSAFGTTMPISDAVVTVVSTTSSSIPILIRSAIGQTADLFRIQDASQNHLFSIDPSGGIFSSSSLLIASSTGYTSFVVNNSGNVGVGTAAPGRRLSILDVNSAPQLRLSQASSAYGEFYVDPTGDLQLSSTGGNFRLQNENLWVCSGGSCGVDTPADKGNVIVETAVIFNNKFKLKQVDASTTILYDSADNEVMEFDEGQ